MKKTITIIIILFIIFIAVFYIWITQNRNQYRQAQMQNYEYEQYKKRELYGTEVITLINKAMNENEKNSIPQNNKGQYIENNTNSIIIEVIMIIDEEKKQTKSYRMEAISKVGISSFITNFNTEKFKIKEITYHENGRIKGITIEQQNLNN